MAFSDTCLKVVDTFRRSCNVLGDEAAAAVWTAGTPRPGKEPLMSDAYRFGGMTPAAGDRTRTLFGQTMGFVALTAGLFALGAAQ